MCKARRSRSPDTPAPRIEAIGGMSGMRRGNRDAREVDMHLATTAFAISTVSERTTAPAT